MQLQSNGLFNSDDVYDMLEMREDQILCFQACFLDKANQRTQD